MQLNIIKSTQNVTEYSNGVTCNPLLPKSVYYIYKSTSFLKFFFLFSRHLFEFRLPWLHSGCTRFLMIYKFVVKNSLNCENICEKSTLNFVLLTNYNWRLLQVIKLFSFVTFYQFLTRLYLF